MSDNVVEFPFSSHPIQPIAQFIRVGEGAYKQLGDLLAQGGLPAKQVVFDASKLRLQKDLIKAFKQAGAEIVLDTKVAELAAPAKYSGFAKGAPWAALSEGGPLRPQFFNANRPDDIYGMIARTAVEFQVDVVLAPTHFLGDRQFDGWFSLDRVGCLQLRSALDKEGGTQIAIDYPLILPHMRLNEEEDRSSIMSALADLPFENLWVRASGFGNDSGLLPVSRYITALMSFHNLGRPIVADYLGGLVGEAAVAMGAVSGLSHGIGERERFNATQWHQEPKKSENGFGGRVKRISLAGINKSLSLSEFELLCSARGGKSLLACPDRRVFPGGVRDMRKEPRRYEAYEALSHIEELGKVPDLRRGQHFLDGRMTDVAKLARAVKELKPSPDKAKENNVDIEKFMKRMNEHSTKVDKLHGALEHLNDSISERGGRARPIKRLSPAAQSIGR